MSIRYSAYILSISLVLAMCRTVGQELQLPKPVCVQINDQFDYIEGGNVRMYVANNGFMSYNPSATGNGFLWPKDSGKCVIYQDGLLYGGLIGDSLHVGGSTYLSSFQAGPILPSGLAADPSEPRFRVYKVRKIGRSMFDTMLTTSRERLRKDFLDWPVTDGAPYIDSNSNGRYDPNFDLWLEDSTKSDKPWFIGDEVIWFVMNDLDSTRTRAMYETRPLGFEVQCLIWTFHAGPPLGDAVFLKYTLINKGFAQIDSFYIGYWTDPDLGNAGDDYVGFDSTHQMAYAYNALSRDGVYYIPPAVGTILLQGPTIRSVGEIATVNFQRRRNFANLPIATFPMLGKSDPVYGDPALGRYSGAIETYRALQGFIARSGRPFIDPTTGKETKLCLAGDPILRTGWVDGIILSHGDRRMMFGSGPLSIASGDTQEVVFATVVARGSDRLNSIVELRDAARILHNIFDLQQISPFQLPQVRVKVSYPDREVVRIVVEGKVPGSITVHAVMRTKNGTLLVRFPLYLTSEPGFFKGIWEQHRVLTGVDIGIEVDYGIEKTIVWPVSKCQSLAGEVVATLHRIESDHRNFDGIANPEEHIRITVEANNQTPFPIGPISIVDARFKPELHLQAIIRDMILPWETSHLKYMPFDSTSYLAFTTPRLNGDNTYPVDLVLSDTLNNCWCSTLSIPMDDFTFEPVEGVTEHVAGPAFGTLGWRLVNSFDLKDHTYRITVRGLDSSTAKSVTIEDISIYRMLVRDFPIPDAFSHEIPIVEGWKLTLGSARNISVESDLEIDEQYEPLDNQWLAFVFPITIGKFFFGSDLQYFDHVPIKMVFDSSRTQKAYRYLRGGSPAFGYVGFNDVPFRVFDISDSAKPRQLNVAFTENAGGPRQNERWDPAEPSDREYLFIFKSSYSQTPQSIYTSKSLMADASTMDIMYGGWYYAQEAKTFHNEDELYIRPVIPVTKRDTFYLNPKQAYDQHFAELLPSTVAINALYPNPITNNGIFTVRLTIGERQSIRTTLFDVFGRVIGKLFDKELDRGSWSIRSRLPTHTSSGIYLLQISTARKNIIVKVTVTR